MNLLNDDQFKILERLKIQGAQSIDSLANWLKKPKTAVRRTLLRLENKNLIKRKMVKLARGRPAVYFQLEKKATSFFASKKAELLSELIDYLIQNKHSHILKKFFELYWENKYHRAMKKLSLRKCKDLGVRLEVLKEVLNEDGFYARSTFSKRDGLVTLKECHCPISAVSSLTDIPCNLESQLISKVLNLNPVSMSKASSTNSSCQFKLKK